MEKILVLCDDMWHPAEVIEMGLADLQDKEFHFDFVKDAKDILTPELLQEYPLIINCKSDCLISGNHAEWFEDGVTEVGPKELEEFVRAGGGFLSIHAGNVSNPSYGAFVGNRFVKHPPRCEVQIHVCKDHPVTQGVQDFTVRDEHYEIGEIANDVDIFLQSTSEKGGTQVAGYSRILGKGKVCVLTPGHIYAVWKNPEFRKLLLNAIRFCL